MPTHWLDLEAETPDGSHEPLRPKSARKARHLMAEIERSVGAGGRDREHFRTGQLSEGQPSA